MIFMTIKSLSVKRKAAGAAMVKRDGGYTFTAVSASRREYIGRSWRERVRSTDIGSVTLVLYFGNRS